MKILVPYLFLQTFQYKTFADLVSLAEHSDVVPAFYKEARMFENSGFDHIRIKYRSRFNNNEFQYREIHLTLHDIKSDKLHANPFEILRDKFEAIHEGTPYTNYEIFGVTVYITGTLEERMEEFGGAKR